MARFPGTTRGIPTPGAVHSFNLANAASLGIYEAMRRTALCTPSLPRADALLECSSMKLTEKGRHAPPPALSNPAAQRVAETVAGWPGVSARTHWQLGNETIVDGADFYLDQDELGHLHLEAEAHVALPTAVVDALLRHGLGARFPWSRCFVVFRVDRAAAVEHALWLFQLSYDRRSGTSTAALLTRVQARAADESFRRAHAGRAGARI